jgi:hypothetical protein
MVKINKHAATERQAFIGLHGKKRDKASPAEGGLRLQRSKSLSACGVSRVIIDRVQYGQIGTRELEIWRGPV